MWPSPQGKPGSISRSPRLFQGIGASALFDEKIRRLSSGPPHRLEVNKGREGNSQLTSMALARAPAFLSMASLHPAGPECLADFRTSLNYVAYAATGQCVRLLFFVGKRPAAPPRNEKRGAKTCSDDRRMGDRNMVHDGEERSHDRRDDRRLLPGKAPLIPEGAEPVNQKGNEESDGERQPIGSVKVLIGAQEATSH